MLKNCSGNRISTPSVVLGETAFKFIDERQIKLYLSLCVDYFHFMLFNFYQSPYRIYILCALVNNKQLKVAPMFVSLLLSFNSIAQ